MEAHSTSQDITCQLDMIQGGQEEKEGRKADINQTGKELTAGSMANASRSYLMRLHFLHFLITFPN